MVSAPPESAAALCADRINRRVGRISGTGSRSYVWTPTVARARSDVNSESDSDQKDASVPSSSFAER